jgi:hypothetical protein
MPGKKRKKVTDSGEQQIAEKAAGDRAHEVATILNCVTISSRQKGITVPALLHCVRVT